MRFRLILVSTFVLSLFAFDSASASSLPKVVVALKPDKNPDHMVKERVALEEFLSKELGRPVKVIIPLTAAVIQEGLANGSIDLAYLSSVDMVNAEDRDSAEILMAGQMPSGETFYESYWVTLKDKPYSSISDLRGKPIAFASKTSTSGYLIPHWDLIKKGLLREGENPEKFFGKGNVWYGTGYVSGIERVLRGQAEGAAVSDYVIETNRYLSPEQKAKLKVFAKQGPIPSHVVAIRKKISEDEKSKIASALTALNSSRHSELREKLFNSVLVKVDSVEHLASTRDALKKTGTKQ